jgi:hypothetical protein
MSELFEDLPEVGDPEKPRLVLFFDEAHLFFDDAPKALMEKIEQVVRLIRSKGVGVYFVTQNPLDVPDDVSSQLGNRIQHALRAYTPREQKAVRAAAETFRPNPAFKTVDAITTLGTGEALVSVLEGKGAPTMVERTLIRPPSSRLGPLTPTERQQAVNTSPVAGQYDTEIDRESAYEVLAGQDAKEEKAAAAAAAEKAAAEKPADKAPTDEAPADEARADEDSGGFGGFGGIGDITGAIFGTSRKRGQRLTATQRVAREVTRTIVSRTAGQMAANVGKQLGGSVGGSVGRAIVRGILGNILRSR